MLRRLEDFVIYMPCIKLSTVNTISIYWTTVLDRCHRSNVCSVVACQVLFWKQYVAVSRHNKSAAWIRLKSHIYVSCRLCRRTLITSMPSMSTGSSATYSHARKSFSCMYHIINKSPLTVPACANAHTRDDSSLRTLTDAHARR